MNTANADASERLTHSTNPGHGLLPMALVLGMSSGLIEGVLHMGLQRLNVLEQVWYQIFWIPSLSAPRLWPGGAIDRCRL